MQKQPKEPTTTLSQWVNFNLTFKGVAVFPKVEGLFPLGCEEKLILFEALFYYWRMALPFVHTLVSTMHVQSA